MTKNALFMFASFLALSAAHAIPLEIQQDIDKLRDEAKLSSMRLRGTSENGGDCYVTIQLDQSYFRIRASDDKGSYDMPLMMTKLHSNSSISNDSVDLQENHDTTQSTPWRSALLSSFKKPGEKGAYPQEVTVGKHQIQPIASDESLHCYSLRPYKPDTDNNKANNSEKPAH